MIHRANPFILPTETFVRFILILIGGVGLILNYVGVIVQSVVIYDTQLITILGILLISLLPFVVWYLYSKIPNNIIRRKKLEPLEDTYPDIYDEVIRLANIIGIKQTLKVWLHRGETYNPFAFGTRKKGNLILPEGLIKNRQSKEISIKPILVHELAHFKNGDVWMVSLAESILRVSIIPSLLTFLYTFITIFIRTEEMAKKSGFIIALDIVLLQVSLVICINSMHFFRELYADAFASLFLGSTQILINEIVKFELDRAFHSRPSTVYGDWGLNFVLNDADAPQRWVYIKRIRKWFYSTHGDIKQRLKCLQENWHLPITRPFDFITTGFILGSTFFSFAYLEVYIKPGEINAPAYANAILIFTTLFFLYFFLSIKIGTMNPFSIPSNQSNNRLGWRFLYPLVLSVLGYMLLFLVVGDIKEIIYAFKSNPILINAFIAFIAGYMLLLYSEGYISLLLINVGFIPFFRWINPIFLHIVLPKLLVYVFLIVTYILILIPVIFNNNNPIVENLYPYFSYAYGFYLTLIGLSFLLGVLLLLYKKISKPFFTCRFCEEKYLIPHISLTQNKQSLFDDIKCPKCERSYLDWLIVELEN
ncbi:MAG: M48 family metallopeptidase [Nitrososphaeraceae archaeon]